MLTFITMLVQKIEEANIIGIMFLVSWIVYLILFFAVKANRQPRKPKGAFIVGALLTALCDILLFFKFFDNFVYTNPGVEALLFIFLFPAVMLIIVMIETYINVSILQHKQRKEEKEQEKLRKKESKKKKFEENQIAEEKPKEETPVAETEQEQPALETKEETKTEE